MTEDTAVRPEPRTPRFGLSGKLLVLTILFVMIAEVLIYVPSVANFRVVWLKDRLATAYTAALVLDAAPNGVVSDTLAKRILDSIGARDYPLVQGLVILFAVIYTGINMLVDLAYPIFDPRIRYNV